MPTLAVTSPDSAALAGGNALTDAAGYVVLALIFASSLALLGVARLFTRLLRR